jgi:myosin-crossreactive antigen
MAVGYPVTSTDLNNQAGRLVVALWSSLNDVRQFKLWLDDSAHSDTFLNNLGITGTASSGDVKTLRDSFSDLGGTSGLWATAHGTFAPAGNSNFFANAKLLGGLNYAG